MDCEPILITVNTAVSASCFSPLRSTFVNLTGRPFLSRNNTTFASKQQQTRTLPKYEMKLYFESVPQESATERPLCFKMKLNCLSTENGQPTTATAEQFIKHTLKKAAFIWMKGSLVFQHDVFLISGINAVFVLVVSLSYPSALSWWWWLIPVDTWMSHLATKQWWYIVSGLVFSHSNHFNGALLMHHYYYNHRRRRRHHYLSSHPYNSL